MIKSLLIVVLALALAAGAALTRPAEADFKPFIVQQMAAGKTGFFDKMGADIHADSWIHSATFKNRILWITAEKDGQTAYVGAFGHWWGSGVKN